LANYQPYHAARADMLARIGRAGDAVAAYDQAIALTTNPAEELFLTRQRAAAAASTV
jgi:RNA polymerase sigma-70 factor (ECF subfamily)